MANPSVKHDVESEYKFGVDNHFMTIPKPVEDPILPSSCDRIYAFISEQFENLYHEDTKKQF